MKSSPEAHSLPADYCTEVGTLIEITVPMAPEPELVLDMHVYRTQAGTEHIGYGTIERPLTREEMAIAIELGKLRQLSRIADAIERMAGPA